VWQETGFKCAEKLKKKGHVHDCFKQNYIRNKTNISPPPPSSELKKTLVKLKSNYDSLIIGRTIGNVNITDITQEHYYRGSATDIYIYIRAPTLPR
jgi:hypothetical protein